MVYVCVCSKKKGCSLTSYIPQLLPVRADDDGREEKAEQQLIQNLMQWVHSSLSEQVTTDSQNNSLEVLSVQILPSIALLLPKIPTQQQYIWIQFTCQILLYLNSKKVIVNEFGGGVLHRSLLPEVTVGYFLAKN